MSRWNLSFIIHAGIWICLFFLALISKGVAQFPVGVLFILAAYSYEFLGLVTGATDPFASRPGGGTQIPQTAWIITQLVLWGILLVWLLSGFLLWRKGKPALIFLLGHILLLGGGLFGVLLTGSINFPFQL